MMLKRFCGPFLLSLAISLSIALLIFVPAPRLQYLALKKFPMCSYVLLESIVPKSRLAYSQNGILWRVIAGVVSNWCAGACFILLRGLKV